MSVRVLTKVFSCSQATLAARLVLLALADSAHDDGVTWIDQDTVAEKARIDARTVRRCVRELEAAGELETRKAQRGQRRINVYRVVAPGLLDPDYDRLPFEVKEPFTTGQSVRPSEGYDRASDAVTTGQIVLDRGGASLLGLNRKDEPSVTPPVVPLDPCRPETVDRKKVTDAEYDKSQAVLYAFNRVAGTNYSSADWHRKIIGRLREHPELVVEAHEVVIRRAFADPWWKGPASPSVVYGNAAVFERAVHAVRVAPEKRGMTPEEIAAFDG